MPDLNIHFKPTAGGDKISLTLPAESSISDLKLLLDPLSSIPAAEQRIIYRGQILKDERTIESYGIGEDHVLHLVRGKKAGSTGGAAGAGGVAAAPTHASSAAPSLPSMTGNPMNSMAMLNDPQAMQAMMSNPVVQSLLDDPEMIRSMMQSNPQLQAIISSNPEMGAVLNDPAMMRQAMDMMRNPALMQEQMRHMDRQLHNIEGMPDGFNRLRSMYESVQEPMINAMMSPAPAAPTVNQPATTVPGSTDPNAAPLPNPWGAAPAATNPASNPAGGLGGFPAGLGGSGLPDMSSLMNNPEAMSSMMNNPMMQQMMRSMSRNPAILQQMMDSNPMIQSNPAMREAMSSMMANPQLLQQMFEPSNMQAMLQMQRSMQQLQANGLMPGMTGMDPMMMQQLMGGQGMGAAPAPVVDPEVTWATQIQQLQDMGFYDRASNISALRATNGNVNLAVERLLAMFQ